MEYSFVIVIFSHPSPSLSSHFVCIVCKKRCRTYINAFVTFLENGRRWRCNICSQLNEVPAPYFCHLDEDGRRRDRDTRPELSQGVVEFVAPSEYMVRPPQPPSYFFIIDVSLTSVRSGMLTSVAHAISTSLDTLPGHPRTQVGFLTYDESVHYYCLKSGMTSPQMLVVADLVELFVPAPDDLLVNLQDCREVIDVFLENLPTMFDNTTSQVACLGPALKAAFTVTKHIGGKMCVFQSVLPTLGDGALVPREQMQIMGTPKEVELLRPAQNWYKETAIEFSRAQIGVDMFLFPRAYIDVAALAELPKITAGTLHTYPGFNYDIDGPRFESELCRCLSQPTAFEAVMRIRCTRGMKISNFYGNFFVRGTDLLALPNCSSDSVFAFDLVHDEQNVTSNVVTIQSALLYTSSDGERRIRVVTQAIPVSSMASEVINSVDADALTCLLAKQALDVSLKTNLDNARNKILMSCVDLIRASKEGDKPRMISGYAAPPPMHGQHQQHGPESESKETPENLKLLPLYTLAMMKNVAFRGGTDIHPDERVHAMNLLSGMGVMESKIFVHPRMFSLHDMTSSAGLPSNINDDTKVAGQDRIELPRSLNLTIDRLASNGIFLLDNGVEMFLWVGRSTSPAILNSLFGTNSLEGIDMSQVKLQRGGNDYASRLNTIFLALREDDTPQTLYAKVIIVREGDHGLESRFFWHLIEDSASFSGGTFSYDEFVQFVNSGGQGGPPGRGPPGGAPNMPHQGGPPAPPQHMQQGPPPPQQNRPPGPPMNQPRMSQGPPAPPMNQGPPPPHHQMQGPPPGGMPGRPMPPPQMSNQQQPPPPAYNGQQQYTSGPPSGQYSGPPSGPPSGGQYSGPPSGPPPPMQINSAPPPPGPPYGRGPPPPGPPPPPHYHR